MTWFLVGVFVGMLTFWTWYILVTEGVNHKRQHELRRVDRELARATLQGILAMHEAARRGIQP